MRPAFRVRSGTVPFSSASTRNGAGLVATAASSRAVRTAVRATGGVSRVVFERHGNESAEHGEAAPRQFRGQAPRFGGHVAPIAQLGPGITGGGQFVQHAVEGNGFAGYPVEFERRPRNMGRCLPEVRNWLHDIE